MKLHLQGGAHSYRSIHQVSELLLTALKTKLHPSITQLMTAGPLFVAHPEMAPKGPRPWKVWEGGSGRPWERLWVLAFKVPGWQDLQAGSGNPEDAVDTKNPA